MKKLVQVTEVENEKSFHKFLSSKGFVTNFKKEINANGVDVVAIKDGYSFHIEIKKIVQNKKTKAFKMSDEKIKGDILIAITPKNQAIVVINEHTSLTKTVRFLDMID